MDGALTAVNLLQVVPRLLGSLVGGSMTPTQHLEQQQALVKQFAEILEFVLKFDEYKVRLQFLYYILPYSFFCYARKIFKTYLTSFRGSRVMWEQYPLKPLRWPSFVYIGLHWNLLRNATDASTPRRLFGPLPPLSESAQLRAPTTRAVFTES